MLQIVAEEKYNLQEETKVLRQQLEKENRDDKVSQSGFNSTEN
jgi:hypothetical protein